MFAPLRLIARRHLFERPVRTMITILGVGLGVSVSVAIRTANVHVLRSFEKTVSAVGGRGALPGIPGRGGCAKPRSRVIKAPYDRGFRPPVVSPRGKAGG